MGPFFDVEQSVRKRKRFFFFFHENEREKNIVGAQRKSVRVSVTDGYFLTLEVFRFADDCSSYIINVLSDMFKLLFDSGEFLEPFFFLLVRLTSLMM